METNVFERLDTVPCFCWVRNWNDEFIDPSEGVLFSLWHPDGTIAKDHNEEDIDEVSMTKLETGKYVYYHNTDMDDKTGWWKYRGRPVDGSGDTVRSTAQRGSFNLT